MDKTSTLGCIDGQSNCYSPKILLGVTGSVAAIKAPEIICKLIEAFNTNISIKVVLTKGGKNFWDKASVYDPNHWNIIQSIQSTKATQEVIQVYYSDDEWDVWEKIGDPVEHIVLRDWADVCVIAPLSAHTVAKLANGLCDDTLSCIVRAWDFGQYNRNVDNNDSSKVHTGKPIILAPAMNTAMWEHPLTLQQLNRIKSFSTSDTEQKSDVGHGNCVRIIEPQTKTLACGEIGVGAMADVSVIVEVVKDVLSCM